MTTSEYKVYKHNEDYLFRSVRQALYEYTCDGCGEDLPGEATRRYCATNERWMFGAMLAGPYVFEVSDRSGSPQAVCHRHYECLDLTVDMLEMEEHHP